MLLTLDTTHKILSLALMKNSQLLASMKTDTNTLSGDMLLPTILDFFKENHISPQDISNLVCTTGPGSFTGVRIGIAFAKAFHLANKIPLYGLNTFEALAWKLPRPLTVVIDSYRGDFFAQDFEKNSVSAPYIISVEEIIQKQKHPITGFIKEEDKNALQKVYIAYVNNTAVNLGEIFYTAQQKLTSPFPYYIRSADVSH